MPNESNRRFQILSLSGGGYRGLYTATVLARLEKEAGKPLGRCFDLIAGTSIGGILALGIALEVPVADMLAEFESNGQAIFSGRNAPNSWFGKLVDLGRSLLAAKYRSEELRKVVSKMLGSSTKLADVKHPVIVPAVNVSTGCPKVFKSPHHADLNSDKNFRVVDVALATSAAPTIFPVAKVGDGYFADGGLFANSPDIMALHEASHRFGVDETSTYVLSVGTTDVNPAFMPGHNLSLGLLRWGYEQRLLSLSFACQEKCTHHMMGHRLKERFIRINDTQSTAHQMHVRLDIASEKAKEVLRALGEDSGNRAMGNSLVREIISNTSPAPSYFDIDKRVMNDGIS